MVWRIQNSDLVRENHGKATGKVGVPGVPYFAKKPQAVWVRISSMIIAGKTTIDDLRNLGRHLQNLVVATPCLCDRIDGWVQGN